MVKHHGSTPRYFMPSQRYQKLKQIVNPKKLYSLQEAIQLIKQPSSVKFDEAVELHVRLGIDPGKSDQQVRGTVVLPHGTGKTKRIAAFVEAGKEVEAKNAGADIVGSEELIEEISKTGKITFDLAVATPSMMPKLAKLARLLGPRGLMPNPKTDTIGPNIGKIVEEQKAGKISFKNDDTANVHQVFGRVSFEETKLQENFLTLLEAIRKAKPSSSKGEYLKSVTIATTMGPGIHMELI